MSFDHLKLNRPLLNALEELEYTTPTEIQETVFSPILAGKDVVGIAQTGTGKTIAYVLPLLRNLKYSEQKHPRILILVPTRELVIQVMNEIEKVAAYMTVRIKGAYGGTNINTQKQSVYDGCDILVATPGRLLDLALSGVLRLKDIKQLVIDEVDEMLNLGFRTQLTNLLDILPSKRQNLLFSATMTEDVDKIIQQFFDQPERFSISPSGERLKHIEQRVYHVENFNTKLNLLEHLLKTDESMTKVLIFVDSKSLADRLEEKYAAELGEKIGVIHSNKSQNYRLRSVRQFEEGDFRILVATDVIARGIDVSGITHVINLDVPEFPENYMHRIGRTGRANREGVAISMAWEGELPHLEAVHTLMNYAIPVFPFPEEVEISTEYTEEERPNLADKNYLPEPTRHGVQKEVHEKKKKNQKVNLGGSYKRKVKEKYKKPKTRGNKPKRKKR